MVAGIRKALLVIALGSGLIWRVFGQNELPIELAVENPEEVVAIKWEELMSAADLEAILNAPPVSHSGYGWEDQFNDGDEDAFSKALKSFDVNPELIGKRILLPGFIVPTTFNDDRKVTEFFLVPFFGACIHVPPPPPNQIIHVTYEAGLDLENLYEAYYILGELNAQVVRHDLADSAYTMNAEHIEVYTY